MNSIFEIVITLNKYSAGKINAADAASIITANLASLNNVETSDLRKLAQSVGFSLADIKWEGESSELKDKLVQLKYRLNQLANEKTSVIEVPEYLIDEYRPEQLLGVIVKDMASYEVRKDNSTPEIFLCFKNSEKQLTAIRKFRCLNDLEEAIWIGSC